MIRGLNQSFPPLFPSPVTAVHGKLERDGDGKLERDGALGTKIK